MAYATTCVTRSFARRVLTTALTLACGTAAWADELQLALGPEGALDLQVHQSARRIVLDRLLAESGVIIEWRDPAFGEESVSGQFKGSAVGITRQILGESNYVMSYARRGDDRRLTRLVVIGRKPGDRPRDPAAAAAAATSSVASRTVRPQAPAAAPAEAPNPTETSNQPSRPVRAPARQFAEASLNADQVSPEQPTGALPGPVPQVAPPNEQKSTLPPASVAADGPLPTLVPPDEATPMLIVMPTTAEGPALTPGPAAEAPPGLVTPGDATIPSAGPAAPDADTSAAIPGGAVPEPK